MYRRLPTALQNLAVEAICAKRWLHESSPGFRRLVARLADMQYWDRGRIERWQRERLADVLLAAREAPYYRDAIPDEPSVRRDPVAVLQSLPLLNKRIVSADPEAFLQRSARFSKLVRKGTSGTTGFPLTVYWSRAANDWERALIWRHRASAGCRMGRDWRGMLGGYRIVPLQQHEPPFWRESGVARLSYVSTFHISPSTAPAYWAYIEKRGIAYLTGYPSALYALALSMRDCGLKSVIRGAFFGAEPLHSFQRNLIEDVFGCYVWDYYGLTERVVSASEFECRNGLHINWENTFFEIVDERGSPVEPGECGELVGTSLSNTAFTLLRYRTGDMTRLLLDDCSCGRSSARMTPVGTKVEDLLRMPDGLLLSASNLTFPFKVARHIRQSQIYQPSEAEIVIRVVPDAGFTEQDGSALLAGLMELFPQGVALSLELVGAIPKTPSGKYAFCVSEVARKGAVRRE